jgi:hypothetical protein
MSDVSDGAEVELARDADSGESAQENVDDVNMEAEVYLRGEGHGVVAVHDEHESSPQPTPMTTRTSLPHAPTRASEVSIMLANPNVLDVPQNDGGGGGTSAPVAESVFVAEERGLADEGSVFLTEGQQTELMTCTWELASS